MAAPTVMRNLTNSGRLKGLKDGKLLGDALAVFGSATPSEDLVGVLTVESTSPIHKAIGTMM